MSFMKSFRLFKGVMARSWIRQIAKLSCLSIGMMALLPWLSACSNTPSSLPFAVQKKGNTVVMEYQIREHRFYFFSLQLMFKEGDLEDRERVSKLAGGYQMDKNGKLIQPGVPIALRFKIDAIDDSGIKTIHEEETVDLRMTSYGKGFFDKRITSVSLKPGRYRFSVESLMDVRELAGTTVVFQVGIDPKTTAIE